MNKVQNLNEVAEAIAHALAANGGRHGLLHALGLARRAQIILGCHLSTAEVQGPPEASVEVEGLQTPAVANIEKSLAFQARSTLPRMTTSLTLDQATTLPSWMFKSLTAFPGSSGPARCVLSTDTRGVRNTPKTARAFAPAGK